MHNDLEARDLGQGLHENYAKEKIIQNWIPYPYVRYKKRNCPKANLILSNYLALQSTCSSILLPVEDLLIQGAAWCPQLLFLHLDLGDQALCKRQSVDSRIVILIYAYRVLSFPLSVLHVHSMQFILNSLYILHAGHMFIFMF